MSPTSNPAVASPVARDRYPRTIETELRRALAAVARHDQTAFTAFYAMVRRRVYGLAKTVLGDHHLAEETAQEVLVEVWTTAASRYVPQRGQVMPWLMTITHRRAVDRVRAVQAAHIREQTYTRLQERLLLPCPRSRPEEQTLRKVSTVALSDAVDMLPAHQRQPLMLAYYGEYTHTQIADILNLPLGTAKTRLSAGLRSLRRQLADQ